MQWHLISHIFTNKGDGYDILFDPFSGTAGFIWNGGTFHIEEAQDGAKAGGKAMENHSTMWHAVA